MRSSVIGVFVLLGLALSIILFRSTLIHGWDLEVLWGAVRLVLEGQSPYAYRYGSQWVFKYPPWIIVPFLPLGFLPWSAVSIFWALLQFAAIFYTFCWLRSLSVTPIALSISALAYWWIWFHHFKAAQVTLLFLWIALWATPHLKPKSSVRIGPLFVLLWAFSAKIFSIFSLIGVWRSWIKPKPLALTALVFAALTAILLLITSIHNPMLLMGQWLRNATESGHFLGEAMIRSRVNQGLPAAFMRLARVPASQMQWDSLAFVILSLIVAPSWFKLSENLSFEEKWAGWLGLGIMVHPMPWFSSFVLAFPLSTLAFDRAVKSKNRLLITSAVVAFFFTGIITERWLGFVGVVLEAASIKSWGIWLSALTLSFSKNLDPPVAI